MTTPLTVRWVHKIAGFIKRPHLPRVFEKPLRSRCPGLHRALKYGTFDATSKKYWDGIWREEGRGTWRTYPNLFREVSHRVPTGSIVLDVGSGPGVLLGRLKAERRCRCFGLDLSSVAALQLNHVGMASVVARLPAIPFKDGAFDVVIGTEVLEHLANPSDSLRQMHRVTKPGGLLICSVPNARMGPDECDEHLCEFDRAALSGLVDGMGDSEILEVEDLGCARLLAIIRTALVQRQKTLL